MAGDNAPHVGQANAVAFKIRRRVQPLERAKEPVGVLHIEPNAVVADENHGFTTGVRSAGDLDLRRLAWPGVLDGFRYLVHYHVAMMRPDLYDPRQVLDLPS